MPDGRRRRGSARRAPSVDVAPRASVRRRHAPRRPRRRRRSLPRRRRRAASRPDTGTAPRPPAADPRRRRRSEAGRTPGGGRPRLPEPCAPANSRSTPEAVGSSTSRRTSMRSPRRRDADGLLHVFVPARHRRRRADRDGRRDEADLEEAIERLLPRDDRYAHRHGSVGHGGDHVLPAFVVALADPAGGGRSAGARHLAVGGARRPEPRERHADGAAVASCPG